MTSSARTLLIVVLVSAGAGAFLAARFLGDGPKAPALVPQQAELPRPQAIVQPDATPPAAPIPIPQQPGKQANSAPAEAAQPAPEQEPPRFDVVRIGARGVAVIAGRAAPGAEVVLLEDGREVGRARADGRHACHRALVGPPG
jgi:hypothetical protein